MMYRALLRENPQVSSAAPVMAFDHPPPVAPSFLLSDARVTRWISWWSCALRFSEELHAAGVSSGL
jgi:hypothetical protein